MATLTESKYPGEAILSEARGYRARDTITVLSGEDLTANQVISKVTASGKYRSINTGGADGSQTAVGILFAAVDATDGDAEGVAFLNDAEFNKNEINWNGLTDNQIATAIGQLLAVGIKIRPGI